MDARTKVPCVLQDIVPFGAAAQKETETEMRADAVRDRDTNATFE